MELKLNGEKCFNEIKRVEDKSEKFLLYFIGLWGAIIFLFLRDNSSLSEKVVERFPDLLKLNEGVNVVGYIFLLMLILYVASTCLYFFKVIVNHMITYKKKSLNNLLEEKVLDFREGVRHGYISSILLIAFFGYILYIKDESLIKLIDIVLNLAGFYIIATYFILFPFRDLVKFIVDKELRKKYKIFFFIFDFISIPVGILSLFVLSKINIDFFPDLMLIIFVYLVLINIIISMFKYGNVLFDKEYYFDYFRDFKKYPWTFGIFTILIILIVIITKITTL